MSSHPTSSPAAAAGVTKTTDWEALWRGGLKKGQRFDVSAPHAILVQADNEGKVPKGRALVPGCGRGYDVALLASPDRFVIGLELSETAAAAARDYITTEFPSKAPYCEIVVGDFFEYEPAEKFNFIYDYTFFCAIPPATRGAWGKKMASLLAPSGVLLTLQFPLGMFPPAPVEDFTRGPPFLLRREFYDEVLRENFDLTSKGDVPEDMSPVDREGLEAFAWWTLRA